MFGRAFADVLAEHVEAAGQSGALPDLACEISGIEQASARRFAV
jgi:hypothetical protein